MKKFLALACALILTGAALLGAAPRAMAETPEKVYSNATLEDSFTDNEVIIVVNPDYNFKAYTPADFEGIGCVAVYDMWSNITPGELCRIMKLTLGKHSKQGVLDAIKVLESREDIHSAEPRFMYAVAEPAPEDSPWPIWAGAALVLLIAAGAVAAVLLRKKSD